MSDAAADALVLRAVKLATAIDRLPRVYYHVKQDYGKVLGMNHQSQLSLERLKQAIDGPVIPDQPLYPATFAWDGRQNIFFQALSDDLANRCSSFQAAMLGPIP